MFFYMQGQSVDSVRYFLYDTYNFILYPMMMSNCIFCKIIAWEIPSVKIREDEKFIAILDAFPNTKGMTLVIPKQHYHSDAFEMEPSFLSEYIIATQKVVHLLKKSLKIHRVAMVMEGMGVDHTHFKLYPLHGVDEQRNEHLSGDPVYFNSYPGYIVSKMWPKADFEELKELAAKIVNNTI